MSFCFFFSTFLGSEKSSYYICIAILLNCDSMIVSFSPFKSIEHSYDGNVYIYTFRCPHCGSADVVKLGEIDKRVFFSGHYMCAHCGKSQYKGKEFNYYHDCFFRFLQHNPIQLLLF